MFANNTILSNRLGILNLYNRNKRSTRIDHTAELRYVKINKNGFIYENIGKISNHFYDIQQDKNTSSNYLETTPLLSTIISYPLIKLNKNKNKDLLIPKIQLNYSPYNKFVTKFNLDSIEIGLNRTSLFSTNRFSGRDIQEKGLWLNTGIKYERETITGKNFGTELGQIFR